MFWKKRESEISSIEYERVFRKMTELNYKIDEVISKVKALETNYDNLRGKFNRQLGMLKPEEPQGEDLNTGIPFMGMK